MDERVLIEDLPWLRLSVEHVLLPNGNQIKDFYKIQLPEYAVVAAETFEGLIITVEQYKHAVGNVIYNLPAGYVDSGETPLDCAKRELCEETGYSAERWIHLGTFFVDGNRGCWKMHAFLALNAYYVSPPQDDALEQLRVILKSKKDVLRSLLKGHFVTLAPALTLSLALLNPSFALTESK